MDQVDKIIQSTYNASFVLQGISNKVIERTLLFIADMLEANTAKMIRENQKDLGKKDPADPRVDRLLLNEGRIRNIASAIRSISRLPYPSGNTISEKKLDNGLLLQKRSVPLGVVGAIYESRPNVTFDIAALCLRSKNACLLKGSKDAEYTNKAAVGIIQQALKENGIPAASVSLLPPDREVLQKLFVATQFI